MDDILSYRPIGLVRTPYGRRIDAPHQATVVMGTEAEAPAEAVLELRADLPQEMLEDLEGPGRPRLRVRLQGIDAPELAQDHGREAKAALETLVLGREVQVRSGRKDAHNRHLGVVLLGGQDLNQTLVAAGHAWHNARFASELPPETTQRYAQAQAEARAQRRGLWRLPHPEAPWDWRKRNPRR